MYVYELNLKSIALFFDLIFHRYVKLSTKSNLSPAVVVALTL
jgi:hypothetical protein